MTATQGHPALAPAVASRGPGRWRAALALALILSTTTITGAQEQRGGGGPRQPVPEMPATGPIDVVLGRPSATAITLSVLCYTAQERLTVSYRLADAPQPEATRTTSCNREAATEIRLQGLAPDRRYTYTLGGTADTPQLSGSFHTQRPPGQAFVFTISADSHLDGNTDIALYRRTLANALRDTPDFHLDLGDTFMTDKHADRAAAAVQYRAQRAHLATLGAAAPLFLVLGNHDGEDRRFRQAADGLAAWSNAMRKRYFPNPQPDGFYTGNAQADAQAGLLQDYYAWHWGDALFIVLNPYWHGARWRGDDRWGPTLGAEQYRWLQRTLETSHARFKFVFIHQLVGGADRQGRGGAEAATFGEWGGRNPDGTSGFAAQRPGWPLPIHALLVRHGVSAVFHGHDHLYARQELDGIVYQEVPQPGHPGEGTPRFAGEYGYRQGTILGGAGHLRVHVTPAQAIIEFVRARRSDERNGEVVQRDVLPARTQ